MLVVDFGQLLEVEAEVTSTKTGELVDPDDPFIRVLLPKGETEDPDVTRLSIGLYLCTYLPPEPDWAYWLLFDGDGEWKTSVERKLFRVRKPKVPRD